MGVRLVARLLLWFATVVCVAGGWRVFRLGTTVRNVEPARCDAWPERTGADRFGSIERSTFPFDAACVWPGEVWGPSWSLTILAGLVAISWLFVAVSAVRARPTPSISRCVPESGLQR